jgi:uncharacterized membrane protein SirB2
MHFQWLRQAMWFIMANLALVMVYVALGFYLFLKRLAHPKSLFDYSHPRKLPGKNYFWKPFSNSRLP